uniref:Uncharacterized protein n=1 Tax=Romanomermis culicivorax TaxID=13658 RepID=A0A915HRY1_ROMCU
MEIKESVKEEGIIIAEQWVQLGATRHAIRFYSATLKNELKLKKLLELKKLLFTLSEKKISSVLTYFDIKIMHAVSSIIFLIVDPRLPIKRPIKLLCANNFSSVSMLKERKNEQ